MQVFLRFKFWKPGLCLLELESVKARLHVANLICQRHVCHQRHTKTGEALTRQTYDLNKHSCAEHSCGGGEFRVQLLSK